MTSDGTSSRLFYFASEVEVRLGDRVELKRFLRKPRRGIVCYISGVSPLQSELEDDAIRQWAIKTDDGAVLPILYHPDGFQPPEDIQFVCRGEDPGVTQGELQ